MRYINKQRHRYACGHTAIANACKYLGIGLSYEKAVKLVEDSKSRLKKNGCTIAQLSNVLGRLKIKHSIIANNTLKSIKKNLKTGAIIWCFSFRKPDRSYGAHYCLIAAHKNNRFHCLNFLDSRSKQYKKDGRYKSSLLAQYIHHTRVWLPEIYDYSIHIPKEDL